MTFWTKSLRSVHETVKFRESKDGSPFDVMTFRLEGLPHFPNAASSTVRLVEFVKHPLSHFIFIHVLATGATDVAFFKILAKRRASGGGV
jgi:hypothetical protein